MEQTWNNRAPQFLFQRIAFGTQQARVMLLLWWWPYTIVTRVVLHYCFIVISIEGLQQHVLQQRSMTNNAKQKRVKEGKNPSNPRLRTAGHLMSSQGHPQFSNRRDGSFSLNLECLLYYCFTIYFPAHSLLIVKFANDYLKRSPFGLFLIMLMVWCKYLL